MFSKGFMLFPTFKKKIGVKKKIGGGGGGGKQILGCSKNIFFRRIILQNFRFSSRFMLFPFKKKRNWCKKKIRVGGGGGVEIIFFFLEEE